MMITSISRIASLLTFTICSYAAEPLLQRLSQPQLDIRKQQDILKEEKLQRELKNDFQQLAPKTKKEKPLIDEGGCIEIREIELEGKKALPKDFIQWELNPLIEPWLDQCLNLTQMTELVSSINALFLQQGFVTTRSFLPEQSLKQGTLKIRIIPGRVQSLQSETLAPSNLKWAFASEPNELLNLRDIEQGLDQINRLASNQASVEMLPGDRLGQTIVQINNHKKASYYAVIGLTGTQIQNGDDYRGRVDLFAEDLTGINDQLIINYNEALAERSSSTSRGVGFDYSFPWRYSLFSFSGSYFEYENIINGTNETFDVTGDNSYFTATFNHTVYRDQSRKVDAGTSMTVKDINNFIQGNRIDVSSRELSIWRLETKWKQYYWSNAALYLNLGMDIGTTWFGADPDHRMERPGEAQYTKYNLSAQTFKPLDLNFTDLPLIEALPLGVWQIGLSGEYQYSSHQLPSSEKILVASSSRVIGFGDFNLTGNQGGWIKVDTETPSLFRQWTKGFAITSKMSLMRGWVPHTRKHPSAYGNALASEFSVQAVGYGLRAQLSAGKLLSDASGIQYHDNEWEFGLSLSYNTL